MTQAWTGLDDAINRIVRVRTQFESGATAFIIEWKGNQYVVTAGHNVCDNTGSIQPLETIRICTDGQEERLITVKDVVIAPGDTLKKPEDVGGLEVDLAVIEPTEKIEVKGNMPALGHQENLSVSQEIVMVSTDLWDQFGIVARVGTVAKIPKSRMPYSGDILVNVRGFPGFSGSPIFYQNAKGRLSIGGVATHWSRRVVPQLGQQPVLAEMIGCFHIKYVVALIEKITKH